MSGPSKPEAPPPAAGGDPSMEDILASIRRILSEDETRPAAPPPAAGAEEDVLVLDESMLRPGSSPAPAAAPVTAGLAAGEAPEEGADEATSGVPDAARADGPALGASPGAPPGASTEPASPAGLVAPEAAAAAAASVGNLLRAIASDRAVQVQAGGSTIEDIVRQILRPLLKEWLDAHLPELVERLVRAEIERVVNRALG